MIKKILLSTVVLTACAGTALAADLPSRRAPPVYTPPPAIPVFTWTGFYVGGQVGYGFGHDASLASATATGTGLASTSAHTSGVIGGAHIGYNFSTQGIPLFGNALGAGGVFGIEGDVDGNSARANYGLGGIAVSNRDNIEGSIRGRLGFAVDRTLFYATGGAAFGGLHNSYVNTITGGTDSFDHTRVGYTVGGGVEYAISNNWSLRAEYRYTDFGHYSDVLGGSTGGGVAVRHHDVENRVQAGFSYKFDTFSPVAAPVVARY